MDFAVTFYKPEGKAEVIKTELYTTEQLINMYSHMLNHEREEIELVYPSKKFTVDKLDRGWDNS